MTTPQQHAIRFRIWQFATPRGWDVTCADIAEALDENPHVIGGVIRKAGWNTRIRKTSYDHMSHGGVDVAPRSEFNRIVRELRQ